MLRLLVFAGLLFTVGLGFGPAPIRWGGLLSKRILVVPAHGAFADTPAGVPQKLIVRDVRGKMHLSEIPYFTARTDNAISWDAKGWCLEAGGANDGDDILVNHCNGGANQQWHWLPWGAIQLKGTDQCLDVPNAEAALDGAPIKLNACENMLKGSWKFDDPIPVETETPGSAMWHAMINFSSISIIGALSLGAWMLGRQQEIRGFVFPESSTFVRMNHSSISLSECAMMHQSDASLNARPNRVEQTIVPAVMAISADKAEPPQADADVKPPAMKSLQFRFLTAFWLIRMADWLQGPYFYEVYSSKVFDGVPASLGLVSQIFTLGFACRGIFGLWIGRSVDRVGRKAGTLAFAVLSALSALSTRSNQLSILLLGRLAGGLGTSLLFCAPETWLAGEHQRKGFKSKWLGQTFGWAYAGDALVAIAAGQLAGIAATIGGPSGPFMLSAAFLLVGFLFISFKWDENVASAAAPVQKEVGNSNDDADASNAAISGNSKPTIKEALRLILNDKKIILLGAVEALFEGAMYIFVLQWAPAIKAAVQVSSLGAGFAIPFGSIFSAFMACCLLGSTLFGSLQSKNIPVEKSMVAVILSATLSLGIASSIGAANLGLLAIAFLLFEVCVGMYFPSVGTLRAKYLPDSHRSIMINIFAVPLTAIVACVSLSVSNLGVQGALLCATGALLTATVSMFSFVRKITSGGAPVLP